MNSYKVADIDGNQHEVAADGYGLHELDAMVEFQTNDDLVFAIPIGRVAWIRVVERGSRDD